jgi:hypothetical protein
MLYILVSPQLLRLYLYIENLPPHFCFKVRLPKQPTGKKETLLISDILDSPYGNLEIKIKGAHTKRPIKKRPTLKTSHH